MRIGIYGANGKMGKELISCLENFENLSLTSAFSLNPNNSQTNNLENFFKNCDAIIDFSSPTGTKNLLKYAKKSPKPICIGTTGLDEETFTLMQDCSKEMPILYATNTSLGVAVLNSLVKQTASRLKDFDIEIFEMHHKFKKDAPSGTALTLGQSAAKARDLDIDKVMVTSRDGKFEARSKDEIGVVALRGGDIVGRHTVGFYANGEFLELNHTATSRATFANGAIKATVWLKEQKNNLYSINDFLKI